MASYVARIQRRPTRLLGDLFVIFMLVIVLIWAVFPLYWGFINSIKFPADVYGSKWIPVLQFEPTLKHWRDLLSQREVQNAVKNSVIISVGAGVVALILGTLAAYALARFRFSHPTNGNLTTWFLSQRVLPPVIFVTPYYLLAREFNLLDSVWALVILNATFNLPFPVIILSQMFREIPREIEEAAEVDGASRLQVFSRIAVPLVAPGLVVSFIIVMAFSWNEYIFAATISLKESIPVPVVIAGAESTRGIDYQLVGVRTTLALLPPAIMALLAQRYIIRGLSLGAVKG
ncbi:MAG TPA: carbohydrate ABC transporter permease [Thermomicrobiales bacterium]